MRSFLELSLDDHIVVCAHMDLPTLLKLRACSRATLYAVAALLRRNLEDICEEFMPNGEHFVRSLARAGAYVAGEAAIRFMLRDNSMRIHGLEVYVPLHNMSLIYHDLELYQNAYMGAIVQPEDQEPEERDMETHALESMTYSWTSRGSITIYESACDDALAPIACRRTSLEATYVNPSHFGTAFPSLLFQRRGLLADWSDGETDEVIKWSKGGFDLRISARAWPEYAGLHCAAAHWVCHTQPRSFSDAGSLRCRMNPLSRRRLESIVLWRLDVRPCGGRCLRREEGQGILGRTSKWAAWLDDLDEDM